jgi:hypothetical protein
VGPEVYHRRPGDVIRDHPRGKLPRHQASPVRVVNRDLACLGLTGVASDVGCKTVANMIKGKTPEEIRKLFNIVNDFTPEEEVRCIGIV